MANEPEVIIEEKSKSKTLIMAAIGVASLIGGGAGGYLLHPTVADALAGDDVEDGELEDGELAQGVETTITSVGDFTLNLRESGRLLQMGISIEGLTEDAETTQQRIPQLRDTILLLASDFSYDELDGMDGKLRLRDEIQTRLNAVLTPIDVRRVYFTSFVVQ